MHCPFIFLMAFFETQKCFILMMSEMHSCPKLSLNGKQHRTSNSHSFHSSVSTSELRIIFNDCRRMIKKYSLVIFEQNFISRYFTSQDCSFSPPKIFVWSLLIIGLHREGRQSEDFKPKPQKDICALKSWSNKLWLLQLLPFRILGFIQAERDFRIRDAIWKCNQNAIKKFVTHLFFW